jgi:tetratricopeptide (TPR) repeat protein
MVFRLAFTFLLGAAPLSQAADSPPLVEGPDLKGVRAEIKAKKYDAALAELKVLVVKNPIPDVYSLLGFALRKTGDRPQAMIYYRKALDINPSHRGALEYQGELFVELGQIDKAKENLAKLTKLCTFGCEEAEDLKEAIEHAPKGS